MQEVKTLGEHGESSCTDRSDVAGLAVVEEVMETGHIPGFPQFSNLQRVNKERPDGSGLCSFSGSCGLLYPLRS